MPDETAEKLKAETESLNEKTLGLTFSKPPAEDSGRQSARNRLWWIAKEHYDRAVKINKLISELPDNLSPEAEQALWEFIK